MSYDQDIKCDVCRMEMSMESGWGGWPGVRVAVDDGMVQVRGCSHHVSEMINVYLKATGKIK